MADSTAIWTPGAERIRAAQVTRFIAEINARHGAALSDFRDLYRWSIAEPITFWANFWRFAGIKSSVDFNSDVIDPNAVLIDRRRMPGARWFPAARLNFAENLLRHRGTEPAIIFRGEDQRRESLSFDELRQGCAAFANFLDLNGIGCGDRVAAYIPNLPAAVIAMLGTAARGAIWSSCSPDFGVPGVIDRFGQIEPRVLICADGYLHKGQRINSIPKVREVCAAIPSIEHLVVVPYLDQRPTLDLEILRGSRGAGARLNVTLFSDIVTQGSGAASSFAQLPFDHPLYIMYSSGTTGKPKCIVHGAGGTLVEHLKEHVLHTDLASGDRLFYQTTCGWMMWNWLVSGLASGATVVLYDGAPFHEDGKILWRIAAEESISVFGTNAKYLAALEKNTVRPREQFELPKLRAVLSTGSPLLPESFDFVYREIKSDLCLSSISGGTDILGCFALGAPTLPVYRGQLQTRSLGMAVAVFDDQGNAVEDEKGELVCSAPFPSMPVGFWNDPQQEKYRAAYFGRFPNVWTHGDFVELCSSTGGVIIYGRSDAVLNPGGIRIGTAEIYRQVERLPQISESIVVGYSGSGDEQILLFVKLSDPSVADADGMLPPPLEKEIRRVIRDNLTAFHVPKLIVAVPDIPRTKSGKIVELAVRQILNGHEIKNREALENPEALDFYRSFARTIAGRLR